MIYNGESVQLEILEKARAQNGFIFMEGEVPFEVTDVEAIDPITFMTEESFLSLPRWNAEVRDVDRLPGNKPSSGRTGEINLVLCVLVSDSCYVFVHLSMKELPFY